MAEKSVPQTGPRTTPVHDHFDGSAHCVECGGPCRLRGVERCLTEMVRWRLEREPWLSICEVESLASVGVDVQNLLKRSKATRLAAGL